MLCRSCTMVLWWWNALQELYSGLMMVKCSAGVVQWSYDGEMLSRSCTVVLWWWNAQQQLYSAHTMVKCSAGVVQWSYDGEMLRRNCTMVSWWWNAQQELYITQHAILSRWCQHVCCGATNCALAQGLNAQQVLFYDMSQYDAESRSCQCV